MKVSRIALIILTRMITVDELCNVTAMTIATMSVTATVTVTTVAAQQQYCPVLWYYLLNGLCTLNYKWCSSIVMGFGQSEILVDAETLGYSY